MNIAQTTVNTSSSSLYWMNGIGYTIDRVNKEHLRKKSDIFFVRISNSICYKIGNLNSEDVAWCHEIDKDISLLTHYIKEVKTRITIFQIIDTIIDPLLAIKRVLIGVLLKEK